MSKYTKSKEVIDDTVNDTVDNIVNDVVNDTVRLEEPAPVLLDTKPVIEVKPVEVATKPVVKAAPEVKPSAVKSLLKLTERQMKNMTHQQIAIYNKGK
jgi:hypothetical protein